MSAPDIDLSNIHTTMVVQGGDPNLPLTTKMIGDSNQPLTTKMLGDSNQPLATLMLGDANKPITTKMIGDSNQPLTTKMIGDANQPLATLMTMQGNPDKPVAMSVSMEMLNLPRLTLQDIKDLMKPNVRMRMPNYQQFCFKLFGKEIFSFCLSGEMQTILEPYVPNSHERCEDVCCEPDTRPFPNNDSNQG